MVGGNGPVAGRQPTQRLVLSTRTQGSGIPRRLSSYAYTPCWAGRAGRTSADQVISRPVRVPAHADLAGLTGSPTPDRGEGRVPSEEKSYGEACAHRLDPRQIPHGREP